MGYTHYYSKFELTHDQTKWDTFVDDVKKVVERADKLGIRIRGGLGEDEPVMNSKEIWLNGDATTGDDHETLHITRETIFHPTDPMASYDQQIWKNEKTVRGFCKTNLKPYDLVVSAVLLLYKKHFEDKVTIDCDGNVVPDNKLLKKNQG